MPDHLGSALNNSPLDILNAQCNKQFPGSLQSLLYVILYKEQNELKGWLRVVVMGFHCLKHRLN